MDCKLLKSLAVLEFASKAEFSEGSHDNGPVTIAVIESLQEGYTRNVSCVVQRIQYNSFNLRRERCVAAFADTERGERGSTSLER